MGGPRPRGDVDVVVVGAGLSGLSCARSVVAAGRSCLVLEASDGVGGRVRSDLVDGFVLDRGFQILLTAYPEVVAQLDLTPLALCPFEPGAVVRTGGGFVRVGDPLRRPRDLFPTLTAPVGTLADKVRLLGLVASVRRGRAADLLRRPDGTTLDRLHDLGFSEAMIEQFLRPLFSGIQLDPDLEVSRRRFDIVFRMLATGDAAVPAEGMGRIPVQIAGRLPAGTVRLGAPVDGLDGTCARLASGEQVRGGALVVATDGPTAARLLGLPDPGSRSAAACWFAADEAPLPGRAIVLDGDRSGPVKNLAVMSEVSSRYAPPGRASIVAAVPGPAALGDVVDDTRAQMRGWFGPAADDWELLRVDRIPHAQPDQRPPFDPRRRVDLGGGRFVCGDHRDTASIQGALFSGRRTAAAVLAALG